MDSKYRPQTPIQWARKGLRRALTRRLRFGDRGATALEFCLLLAFIVIPGYGLIRLGLLMLAEHYRMIVTLNALPLP